MNRSLLLLCVGVSSSLTTFAAVDVAKLPAASARKGLTYATDIKPLFEASCTRCHGEERQRGGLRLDSLQAVMAGGENGKILTPGKGAESGLVHAVSQLDDETAMPPKRGGGGRGGPGGQGGPGGPGGQGGGRGGFGPGGLLATQMMSQGDSNTDKKLSQDEFGKLAESWYAKLDAGKTGKLTQEQFVEKLGEVLPMPQRGGGGGNGGPGGGGGGGGRGGGPARFLGPGLFGATDTDKDGSLTLAEWKGTFSGWFSKWDADKAGALSEEQVRTGLTAALPAPQFGGRRGGGQGGGGQGGPGGPGGGGGGGGQNKPLTAEEVGLVRAWIDQGAK